LHRGGKSRVSEVLVSAALAVACSSAAHAQTVEYFVTPWVVAPNATQGATSTGNSTTSSEHTTNAYSNLYKQALEQEQNVSAPPILYTLNAGIIGIATDNISEANADAKGDLASLVSLGGTVTADTVRLNGILAMTGYYRHNVVDTDLDQLSEYGYGRGRGVLYPGHIYVDLNGLIDDVERSGAGVLDNIVQSPLNTHVYNLSASPVFLTKIDDLGRLMLRYQIGQAWFNNNTAANPLFGLAPIGSSTTQSARGDVRLPGTIFQRLMSDITANATENDSHSPIAGILRRANGEFINEYEVTRSASIIAGAGYEYLQNAEVPIIDGRGPTWDFGGRMRPNADSSIVVVYGRHDRKSDFAGEIAWRLTPSMDVYAKYADSLTTVQQSLINNNAQSLLGPDGALSGIGRDESTLIGVLDDADLSAGAGNEAEFAGLGIPLGTANGLAPLQNGLFRARVASGSVQDALDENSFRVTAFYQRNLSLTPLLAPSSTIEGTILTWFRPFTPRLTGDASVGYRHLIGAGGGDAYNAAFAASYKLSESLAISARYDFIRRKAELSDASYIQNAITIGIHKSFQ
jgi:uncharacterized protein (PEP-CTERM system associated)